MAISNSLAQAAAVAGTTQGSFKVTETGAASYSIPITVPPSTSGMTPNLSLNYNSQSGNGVLGMGWSLGGLSGIYRCPTTIAQDGVKGGVNYDSNDRFCLDGQRLVAISGVYGANNTEYRTETESYTRIVSYGAAGNGPASFKAWTKAGQIFEYGNTADSRIESQGKTTVRLWNVNKVSDTKGNYFTVTYTENNANGEFYVDRINYTGNDTTGLKPYAAVQLGYETRPDVSNSYEAGSLLKTTKRITTAKIFNNSSVIKEYRFVYEQDNFTNYSMLSNIKECGSDNSCLTTLVFSYSKNQIETSTTKISFSDWGYDPKRRWWIDFNGDGKPDYCRAIGNISGTGNNLSCSLSTGSDLSDNLVQVLLSDWGYPDRRWWIDFNGDGKPDYCRAVGNSLDIKLGCSLSTGNGLSGEYTVFASLSDWGDDPNKRWWIDFNGDGRPDYCRAVGKSLYLDCSLSTGSGLSGEDTVMSSLSDWGNDPQRRWWIDFNGDGRPDYCRAVGKTSGTGSKLGCSLSTGNGLSGEYTVSAPLSDWGYPDRRWWVDFNGDGKPDYCRAVGKSLDIKLGCSLSTGNGLSGEYTVSAPLSDWGYDPQRRWWIDFNGDGKPDYCRAVNDSYLDCSLSTGSRLSDKPIHAPLSDWGYDPQRRWWIDFNGDGKPDYCRAIGSDSGSGSYIACTQLMTSNKPNILISVANSNNVLTTISYKALTDPTIYAKGSDAAYPYLDLQTPLYVVTQTQTSYNIGDNYTTYYTYAGAKTHLTSGVFLGFNQIAANDPQTGTTTTTTYNQEYPYQGLPLKVEKKTVTNLLLSSIQNTWQNTIISGTYHHSDLTQTIEQTWDLSGRPLSRTQTNTTYDAYGNATQTTVAPQNWSWGICAHSLYASNNSVYGNLENQFKTMNQYGLKTYRFDVYLTDDRINTPILLKTMIDLAKKYNITLHPILSVPFFWGDNTDGGRYPNTDSGLYQQGYKRTYEFVKQFSSLIKDWELPNELYNKPGIIKDGFFGNNASDYETDVGYNWASVLKGMSDAIRDVQYETKIKQNILISEGYIYLGLIPFLEKNGVSIDKVAYHYYYKKHTSPYKIFPPADSHLQPIDIFAELGKLGKPVIINEFNSAEVYDLNRIPPTYNDQDALLSFKTHIEYILKQNKANIEGIEFYELYDEPRKTDKAEANFGLMKDQFNSKTQILLAAVYSCGTLSETEQNILVDSGLFTIESLKTWLDSCPSKR